MFERVLSSLRHVVAFVALWWVVIHYLVGVSHGWNPDGKMGMVPLYSLMLGPPLIVLWFHYSQRKAQ